MKTIQVKVKEDHLKSMAKAGDPILAIAELVWNSLDADSTSVRIKLFKNLLGGIEKIEISDDGHGIYYRNVKNTFGNLGGSWKKSTAHSKSKRRLLHGYAGKGRFQAFSLGDKVTWVTRYEEGNLIKEYKITGKRSDIGTFNVSDPHESSSEETGTRVTISNISKELTSLHKENALDKLTIRFAPYLIIELFT